MIRMRRKKTSTTLIYLELIIKVAVLHQTYFFSFSMVLCVAGKSGFVGYIAESSPQSLGATDT